MPLTVSSLSQRYGSALILEDVSFTIETLSCLALLGRNGAGKTTLLRTLIGMMPTPSGRIRFDGANASPAPSHVRARAGMGYAPQGREIFADLTVGQNIDIVLRNHSTPNPTLRGTRSRPSSPCSARYWRRRGGDLSGWAAAAARHRPRACAPAEAPHPRSNRPKACSPPSCRTSRPPSPPSRAAWRSCWSSSTTISPVPSPTPLWPRPGAAQNPRGRAQHGATASPDSCLSDPERTLP